MSNGGAAAGAAAAAAAAIANAIKASGVIVRVSPDDFQSLLSRARTGLMVHAQGSFFSRKHKYLFSYKGFAFFTQSSEPINAPSGVETIRAGKIWVPT